MTSSPSLSSAEVSCTSKTEYHIYQVTQKNFGQCDTATLQATAFYSGVIGAFGAKAYVGNNRESLKQKNETINSSEARKILNTVVKIHSFQIDPLRMKLDATALKDFEQISEQSNRAAEFLLNYGSHVLCTPQVCILKVVVFYVLGFIELYCFTEYWRSVFKSCESNI